VLFYLTINRAIDIHTSRKNLLATSTERWKATGPKSFLFSTTGKRTSIRKITPPIHVIVLQKDAEMTCGI